MKTILFLCLLVGGIGYIHQHAAAQEMFVEEFVQNMVIRHGFDRYYLDSLLSQAKVHNSILKLVACFSTPERKYKGKPWYQYRQNFINDKRIQEGKAFRQEYASILTQAEARFGVPAEIIVAIIGVETIYGQNTGSYRVLDALKTLAFHCPRRADYFRQELENFLILTRDESFNPLDPKGSYAGAMGIGQFMPSSYRNYAVDFDGDGKRDIWSNFNDAIGSIANYLSKHGWQRGQDVIKATQVRPDAVERLLSLEFKPRYTVKELKQQGLLMQTDEYDNYLGLLVDLETELGTLYWTGFENFYVITRYNKSNNYAMAVYQLAQEIAGL